MRPRTRGLIFGVLFAGALLLGCGLGRTKCTSSAECNAGEICGGLGNGPFQCLKACATSADCGVGMTCTNVNSADCLECGVITTACVTETVTLPGK